jgi:hypothetical protein
LVDKWIECYYGQSGTGKSEAIAALILKIYQETGKTARVMVGDGSGATYAALVSAGIAEIIDYSIRDWPLSTLNQLAEGYWPEDPADPKSPFKPMTKEKFATIGLNAIEGLSVGANYVMGDKKGGFSARAALGEKIAGDSPIQLLDLDRNPTTGQPIAGSGPGLAFGGVTLGGYGHAQRRMLGFIEKSKGLPGWVIWTAHERSAEDKVTAQKLIGPEVAGGALTAIVSRLFNNTLHFATAEKTVKEKDEHTGKAIDVIDAEYRIYTRDHFRPEGNTFVKYKAVCRTPDPQNMPLFLESNVPGQSILEFYQKIAEARQRQIAKIVAAKEAA